MSLDAGQAIGLIAGLVGCGFFIIIVILYFKWRQYLENSAKIPRAIASPSGRNLRASFSISSSIRHIFGRKSRAATDVGEDVSVSVASEEGAPTAASEGHQMGPNDNNSGSSSTATKRGGSDSSTQRSASWLEARELLRAASTMGKDADVTQLAEAFRLHVEGHLTSLESSSSSILGSSLQTALSRSRAGTGTPCCQRRTGTPFCQRRATVGMRASWLPRRLTPFCQ